MMCPICHCNGVSFRRIWIKSGWGSYTCRDCGSELKVRKNIWLVLLSILLAGAAFTLGFAMKSWIVLFVAVIPALVLDAMIDWRFRVLIPVEKTK